MEISNFTLFLGQTIEASGQTFLFHVYEPATASVHVSTKKDLGHVEILPLHPPTTRRKRNHERIPLIA
jgi:hypothetical protein